MFGQSQILQTFLIDEINSTNAIENIYSTRHDIFYILKNNNINKSNKIRTITKTYLYLLENGSNQIKTKKDIRDLYDYLFLDILDEKDKPDGEYFRNDVVYITDGNKKIHTGFYPEKIINSSMDEFLKLYNKDMEPYIKNIISHFMLETIHPYYDGNGRLGRLLFSNNLFKETNSYFSFLISKACNKNKAQYYKAFKEGRDIHQFGCINEYVCMMLEILSDCLDEEIKNLTLCLSYINKENNIDLSKNQKLVYQLLKESTYLSSFGVSYDELIKYSGLSRRTIVTIMKYFKENNYLDDVTIGRTTYYKIKNIQ